MGYTLPPPDSPREQIRALTAEKESIEAQLEAQISVLKANNSTMQSPLVDPDGFPRADIDIYAVRGARVRVIELRNDLGGVMNNIGTALERVYDPAIVAQEAPSEEGEQKPFAKVNGVAPGSPAAEAVRSTSLLQLQKKLTYVGLATRGSHYQIWQRSAGLSASGSCRACGH